MANKLNIRALSSKVDSEVRSAFNDIRSWGQSIDALTYNDLKDLGLLDPPAVDATNPPYLDPTVPPILANFTATGAFNTIIIDWNDPGFQNTAWVEIWRSATDNIGEAVQVATVIGAPYADTPPDTSTAVTYYYWGRIISLAGVEGPWNATLGTPGSTADDPAYILELLLGQLGYEQFDSESGVFPIRTVTVLPTLPDPLYPVGSPVYLTTDGKLYRNKDGVWTAAVAASDLTGQIVADQIADDAITTAKFAAGIEPVGIVSVLPDPVGYTGPSVVYLSTDGKLYRYVDGAWVTAVSTVDLVGDIVGDQIADGALNTAKFAAGIEPVGLVDALPSPAGYTGPKVVMLTTTGKLYRYTGSAWTATVPTSDLSGTISSAQIAGLAASKITGQLSDDQIADLAAAKLTGQITGTQVTDLSISTPKLAAGAVTAAKIAANTITADQIAAVTITSAELATGSVIAAKIAAGAVTTTKIAADAVTANEIAANAVTSLQLAADSVIAGKIAAGAVSATEIAADAITTAKIAAGAVTTTELAAGAVTATKIAAGTITANEIAANAITSSELATGSVIAGKIAAGAVSATEIAADAVTTAKIYAGAVTATELAAGAVTVGKIAAGAVDADAIAANAITAGKIATGAIVAGDGVIANLAIGTAHIINGAITAAKIGNLAVDTAHIADGAITNAKISNLSADNITAGTYTGLTFQTTASGQRVVINASDNQFHSYGNKGNGTVIELATIGVPTYGGIGCVAIFGSSTSGTSKIGVVGASNSVYGVQGTSVSGTGIVGTSTSGRGIQAISESHIALDAGTNSGTHGVAATNGLNSATAIGVEGYAYYGIGVVGTGGVWDFHAEGSGTNGPFTGAHDALIHSTAIYDVGDIVVDTEIFARQNVSSTLAKVRPSNAVKEKAVIGIVSMKDILDNIPVAIKGDSTLMLVLNDYDAIIVNALGEGQINVCKDGGNIEAGDYICSSSRAGKGMKQDDDLLHNYTVAKAREGCVWAEGEDNIRMIACTYHCG